MKKIIALALITSFAVSGTALAQVGAAAGQGSRGGGNEGPGASDNNGVELVRVLARPKPRPYRAPKKVEFCHIGGETAASDNECSHYSR